MKVFDLDRYVVREYERFARSFTNIHARDLKSKIAEAYRSAARSVPSLPSTTVTNTSTKCGRRWRSGNAISILLSINTLTTL
jgi:hypothetical protein